MVNFDEYNKSLTKSVRQNIRTAYNRLHRDEHVFSFDVCFSGDESYAKLFKLCNELYIKRQQERYKKNLYRAISYRHFNWATKTLKTSKMGFGCFKDR